jgi:hypothetical protein
MHENFYKFIDLPLLRSFISMWAESHPLVAKVTLYQSPDHDLRYVLIAEVPPFPDKKMDKRRKYQERSRKQGEGSIFDRYPPRLKLSAKEEDLIDLYESTGADCSHCWDWLPRIYEGELPQLYRHEWMWLNVQPGEELDDTLLFIDSGHVLYEKNQESNVTRDINTSASNNDPDTFIRQLRVGFSSDESICVHPEGGTREEFDCETMGFKKGSKTWQVLIAMLNDGTYYVGIYDKNDDHANLRNYNRNRKLIKDCSKKIISFLNQHYSLSLPQNMSIFENLSARGIDRPGIYGPVFQIIKPTKYTAEVAKNMSDEEIKRKVEKLSKTFKKLKDRDKKDNFILKEVAPIVEIAGKRGLLDARQYRLLFPTSEDNLSEDALDETVSEPYDDGRMM